MYVVGRLAELRVGKWDSLTISPYKVWGKVINRDRRKGIGLGKRKYEKLSWVEKLILLERFIESSYSIECPSEIRDYQFEVSQVSMVI